MGILLQLNIASSSISSSPLHFNNPLKTSAKNPIHLSLSFSKPHKFRAVTDTQSEAATSDQDPPAVNFAFVASVLLPDGTPDVQYRTACGGQKLRDIMLDNDIELYGPYARPLLNCAGGGTCGTCIVEVVQGRELLNPRTDKEKEKLKRNPKNWRLACQATVGNADSRGEMVIQQLPEWKDHQWNYGEEPSEDEIVYI